MHSRGVRPIVRNHNGLFISHFNSRTHVECDKQNRFRHQKQRISTHALTWSATFMIFVWNSRQLNFNSRTHVECDNRSWRKINRILISTHALTWSATFFGSALFVCRSFQLTHSRGVRQAFHRVNPKVVPFQLTHSRGVRHIARRKCR